MIECVYKRAMKYNLKTVIIASNSHKCFNEVKSFGREVILTDNKHSNVTSRIA